MDAELGGQLAVDGAAHLGLDQVHGFPLRGLEQTRAAVCRRVRIVPGLGRRVGAGHGAASGAGQEKCTASTRASGEQATAGDDGLAPQ